MCWSRALLEKGKKINKVEVNIKTDHVTYGMSRDFNPEGHDITIHIDKNIMVFHKNHDDIVLKNC